MSHLGHRKPNVCVHIEKPTHQKRVKVWWGFWSRCIIGPFFFENCKKRPLQSMAIVIGPCWKADVSKMSHCLVRILVQRHNWVVFLRKWARRGRYSQWWSLSGHIERIFVHKNWRGGYWQHLVSTQRRYVSHSRSYIRCFGLCF